MSLQLSINWPRMHTEVLAQSIFRGVPDRPALCREEALLNEIEKFRGEQNRVKQEAAEREKTLAKTYEALHAKEATIAGQLELLGKQELAVAERLKALEHGIQFLTSKTEEFVALTERVAGASEVTERQALHISGINLKRGRTFPVPFRISLSECDSMH